MEEDKYYFGTRLASRLDYYAFLRTGSHFLWNCFTGLFDLVFFENEFVYDEEAMQRRKELEPMALYALKLRSDTVSFQPVFINAAPNGLHGQPQDGPNPIIILIRDPYASIYSLYLTACERWGLKIDNTAVWIEENFTYYREFYDKAFQLFEDNPDKVLIVSFEALKAKHDELQKIVDFVGVTPKLKSEYVFWWTRFERITKEGKRTFYRSGNNDLWKEDKPWREALEKAQVGEFSKYGYSLNE